MAAKKTLVRTDTAAWQKVKEANDARLAVPRPQAVDTAAWQRVKEANDARLAGLNPDPNAAARAQFNTLLGDATNSANRGYRNTLDDSIAGEGATALDFGATLGSRDPNLDPGAVTQGSYDWNNVEANNPFSKAGLLVRQYRQQQNRTMNGLASQGHLYSGALNNARSQDTFGYQAGQDTLLKGLQNYLGEQARRRRDAGVTKDDAITGAGLSGLGSLLGS